MYRVVLALTETEMCAQAGPQDDPVAVLRDFGKVEVYDPAAAEEPGAVRGLVHEVDAGLYRAVVRDGMPVIEREDAAGAVTGVVVRCSSEVVRTLGAAWSPPVVCRIEDGEFVFATVDPRLIGGSIAGPGGPFEEDSVVIDTTHSVILEAVEVCIVGAVRKGVTDPKPITALVLRGRINKTDERVQALYLLNEDGAAGIVTEIIDVCARAGWGNEFVDRIVERLAGMPEGPRA